MTKTSRMGRAATDLAGPLPGPVLAGDAVASPAQMSVPLQTIAPHPLNPRGPVIDDVSDLAKSIATHGILQPIVVIPRTVFLTARPELADRISAAEWVCLAGHRRLAAARKAKCTTVPVTVNTTAAIGDLDVVTMLVENLQREDLSPLDEARAFQRLTAAGMSQRVVAKQVSRNQSHVARRLALLKLPEEILAKMTKDELGLRDAETLAGASNPEVMVAASATLLAQPYLGAKQALHNAQCAFDHEQQRHRVRAQLETGGIPITPTRPDDGQRLSNEKSIAQAIAAGTARAFIDSTGEAHYYGAASDTPAVERKTKDDAHRLATKTRRQLLQAVVKSMPRQMGPVLAVLTDHILSHATNSVCAIARQALGVESNILEWKATWAGKIPEQRRLIAYALAWASEEEKASGVRPTDPDPNLRNYLDALAQHGPLDQLDQDRLAKTTKETS